MVVDIVAGSGWLKMNQCSIGMHVVYTLNPRMLVGQCLLE
jgi:hypothetical protein